MTTLLPAYGKDYRSKREVIEAWESDRDFIIADMSHPSDGRYTSRKDWKGQSVSIRYCKKTKIVNVKG